MPYTLAHGINATEYPDYTSCRNAADAIVLDAIQTQTPVVVALYDCSKKRYNPLQKNNHLHERIMYSPLDNRVELAHLYSIPEFSIRGGAGKRRR